MVQDFHETAHRKRDNTDFSRPLRESGARLRLAGPPPARRNGAPHGRGAGGESDPRFFGAGAPPGRVKVDRGPDTFTLPLAGRSHHSDPCGKAEMLKIWTRVVLLNLVR